MVLLLLVGLFALASAQNPDKCLGEFQYCSISGGGVCAMDCTNAKLCKDGQYVCPISKKCIDKVEDYVTCPGLKGTHLDWNLTLEERVQYLVDNMTLDEKYPQLTNQAEGINRLGIPFYNYRSNDIHSIFGVPHSTVFPDGCGVGGMWSKNDTKTIGYIIGFEQRSLHNSFIHSGNRNPNDGGAITNNGPNINLVRDPRCMFNVIIYIMYKFSNIICARYVIVYIYEICNKRGQIAGGLFRGSKIECSFRI